MKYVKIKAKSYIVLMECAGHIMQAGDEILVDEKIADRMLLQYKVHVEKSGEGEMDKLAHGHYQLAKMSMSKPMKASDKSMGTQSGKPKDEEVIDVVAEPVKKKKVVKKKAKR